MPRVTFSNELNDFVKGFTAGSAIYDAAEERQIKKTKAQAEADYYAARKAALGPDQGAEEAKKKGAAEWSPPTSAVPTTAKPAAGNPTQLATGMGDDRDLMIRTIYGEAGGESPEGQAAVAHVINNRLNSGKYGKSLRDVVLAPKQFSMWNSGDPAGDVARKLSPDSPAYQRIAALVDKVRGGEIADPTRGADHYYNPHVAHPTWGPQLAQVNDVTIGNHRFVGHFKEGGPVYDHNFADPYDYDAAAEPDDDADDARSDAIPTRVASAAPPSNAIPPQTAATETATPPGNMLDALPEVLKAGLNGLQDMFGLRASAAPGGDSQTINGARAMLSGDGAAPPEQVKAVNQKVDPEGNLDAGLREIAGLNAVYKYYVDKGDMKGAQRAAAQLLQTNFLQTQQLGALAVQALQSGQSGPATQALLHAFNSIPNGKRAEVQDGKVVITDQKTGAPVDQLPLNEQTMLKVATGFADGSLYYNQLMAVASGKPSAPPAPEPDTAYEDYVAGKPSAVPTQPTAPTADKPREPAGPPIPAAPEEESVEETFKPTGQRPQMESEPEMPDLGHMEKGNQVNAQRIYKDRLDQVRTRNQLTDTQYKQALAQEQKDWTDQHNVSKQRRHEESGKIDEAYDNLMMARPEGAPEVPPSQQNDIKEAARGFVRTQDMSREQGVRVAMQAYDPKAQVELKDLKGGGKITFADGRSYKLDSETFSRVKKARNSFKEQADKDAADAKKSGAWLREIKSAVGL